MCQLHYKNKEVLIVIFMLISNFRGVSGYEIKRNKQKNSRKKDTNKKERKKDMNKENVRIKGQRGSRK